MLEAYRKYLNLAHKNKAQNKKLLAKIKQQRKGGLDALMQQWHEEAFEEIDCLQCANCCKTTGPLLLSKDIDRLASELSIRPSQFAEKYIRRDEDGDDVFKTMPCPFLGSDHYCSVYNARPNACREYPHTQQRDQLQKLPITFQNSLICPAVAKIVEQLKEFA